MSSTPHWRQAGTCLLALSLMFVGAPAPPAQAQGSTAAARAEARRLLREGNRAFDQGNHAGALTKFEKALQIFPSARIQYNIGQALRELRRPVEATEAFETFLANANRISNQERRATNAALKELDSEVARLTVITNVPEVEVTIDGRTRGKTPLPGHVVLAPGTHDITLGRAGYKPLREPVTLVGGERKRASYILAEIERPAPVTRRPLPAAPPIVMAPPLRRPPPPAARPTPPPASAPALVDPRPSVVASDSPESGWRTQTILGASLLAASAAFAVGGGALLASSWSRFDQADDNCRDAGDCQAAADQVDSRALWSKLLFGAAALTGAGGAAALLIPPRSRPGDVASGGMLLVGQGRF